MKIKSLLLVCLFAGLAVAASAGPLTGVLLNGFQYTNATIAYNGTTWQIGTTAAATINTTPLTNTFNLNIGSVQGTGYTIVASNAVISTSQTSANGFVINGGQVNTNLLPVFAINTYPGYPNTLYGPMNLVSVYAQISTTASSAVLRTFQINWYQSNDGTNVAGAPVTPAFSQFVTIPIGATTGNCISNFLTQATPYLLMGQLVNSNEVTGTNLYINVSGKTDF